MNDILSWMETSALGQLMRDSVWLFPMAEILHFMGLSLLIGSVMIVDLRLLGVIRDMSFHAVYKFLPISFLGFAINMTTGVLFCFNRSLSLLSEYCLSPQNASGFAGGSECALV